MDRLGREQIEEVATSLAEGPLYRTYAFEIKEWSPPSPFYFFWPDTVSIFCSQKECQQVQRWETLEKSGNSTAFGGPGARLHQLDYLCRNCKHSIVHYFVLLSVDKARAELTKVGQWPPLSREEIGRAHV